MDWSHEEVEAMVADYLQMLTMELAGQNLNKTASQKKTKSSIALPMRPKKQKVAFALAKLPSKR